MTDDDGTLPPRPHNLWWSARRWPYNVALIKAGIVAFIAYVLVISLLVPADAEIEITVFTLFFQGVGYLVMMVIANLFYNLGPLSEEWVQPANLMQYRNRCYKLGFWFSVLLPFSVPVLLALQSWFSEPH